MWYRAVYPMPQTSHLGISGHSTGTNSTKKAWFRTLWEPNMAENARGNINGKNVVDFPGQIG